MHYYLGLLALLSVIRINVKTELNLPLWDLQKWSEEFGNKIHDLSKTATAIDDLKEVYSNRYNKIEIRERAGGPMVQKMAADIQNMLQKKVVAVTKLVKEAEKANLEHVDTANLEVDYYNAKELLSNLDLEEMDNTTVHNIETRFNVIQLTPRMQFNNIPVNESLSTVHVPTNVFDKTPSVLNGVSWSDKLDKVFIQNFENDNTLSWQYFGSSTGFFRVYPGMKWPRKKKDNIDLFDCRVRGWYIQAATSPKDIVILVDASGSMKGMRMEIARSTIGKILDTLSDDDYFNIISFAETPQYVYQCFNRTLIQANTDNRKRLRQAVNNITTSNIARFEEALTEAFELFNEAEAEGKGTICNRAIMLITDGAPENYEEIFQTYNWPNKTVRVFTYLIGREVSDNRQVKWMACANKGFYTHISTLADVQENVQKYVKVLSRPMVIYGASNLIWTPVYMDYISSLELLDDTDQATKGLMTSVAQPVYDKKNGTIHKGNLLGVIGTDVPLKELIKLTPSYLLGVNGYSFGITNNGYLLFHPDFRPVMKQNYQNFLKPNYNSVDLNEVELGDRTEMLRTSMVDRSYSSLSMKVTLHYDSMNRVTTRENEYYYTPIEDTPFSLGIVFPKEYGRNYLYGGANIQDYDPDLFADEELTIAPWSYCKTSGDLSGKETLASILKFIEAGKSGNMSYFQDNCDQDLVESLLFDADVTSGMLSSWIGQGNYDQDRRLGIELVFVGTQSGLTRYMKSVANLTEPGVVERHRDTISSTYYKRAVEAAPDTFIYSVPFYDDYREINDTMVTASAPIQITSSRNSQTKKAFVSVVGLQMQYRQFKKFFFDIVNKCPDSNSDCKITCENESMDCFLIDNNGFIVVSKYYDEVGKFLGDIKGNKPLFEDLLRQGVFESIDLVDYQGVCEIYEDKSQSGAGILLDPIRKFFMTSIWMVKELILFLAEWSIFNWFSGSQGVEAAVGGDPIIEFTLSCDRSFTRYIATNVTNDTAVGANVTMETNLTETCQQLFNLTQETEIYSDEEDADYDVEAAYASLYQNFPIRVPKLLGYHACDRNLTIYRSNSSARPVSGTLINCNNTCEIPDYCNYRPCNTDCQDIIERCHKSYAIFRVPKTNLLMLITDGDCQCGNDRLDLVSVPIEYNDTTMCQRLQTGIYRKSSAKCYDSHPEEDMKECGQVNLLSSPLLVISCMILVLLLRKQMSYT